MLDLTLRERTEDVCAQLMKAAKAQRAGKPSLQVYNAANQLFEKLIEDFPDAESMRHVMDSVPYTAPEIMGVRVASLKSIAKLLESGNAA